MKLRRWLVLACLGLNCFPAHATTYPNYFWDVRGVIRDWKTKAPVKGALVLVFFDGAPMHQGANVEQGDYPDLPKTGTEGAFFATSVLYRSPPKERPETIEVVVLAEGYKTAREVFKASDAKFEPYSQENLLSKGLIELPNVDIPSYDYLNSEAPYAFPIKDSEQVVRVARACVRRSGWDYSHHDLQHPVVQPPEPTNPAWRLFFPLQENRVKGGQIVVILDSKTGRCVFGHGK